MEMNRPSERGRAAGNIPFAGYFSDGHQLAQSEITAPGTAQLEATPDLAIAIPSVRETGDLDPAASQAGWRQCIAYERTAETVLDRFAEHKTCIGPAPYEQYVAVQATAGGVHYAIEVDGENTVRIVHPGHNELGQPAMVKQTFYADYGGPVPSVRTDVNGYLALSDSEVSALMAAGIDSGNPVIPAKRLAELSRLLEHAEPPRTTFDDIWRLANSLATAHPPTVGEARRGAREFYDYINRRIQNHARNTTGAERESVQEAGRYTKNIAVIDPNHPDFAHSILEYTVTRHEPAIGGPSLRLIRHQRFDADGQPARNPENAACERIEGLHIMALDKRELTCGIFSVTAYADSYIQDEPIIHVRGGPQLARLARDIILSHPG